MGKFRSPANPDHLAFAIKWFKLAERLYREEKIVMHRLDFREGGLDKIEEGLADLRNGKVSGRKVVYRIAEP